MKESYTGKRLHKIICRLSHEPDHARITSADALINSSVAMPYEILRFDNASKNRADERLRLLEDATRIPIESVNCRGLPVNTWYPIRRNTFFRQQQNSSKNKICCSGVDTGVFPAVEYRSSDSRRNWSRFWVN